MIGSPSETRLDRYLNSITAAKFPLLENVSSWRNTARISHARFSFSPKIDNVHQVLSKPAGSALFHEPVTGQTDCMIRWLPEQYLERVAWTDV